MGCLWSVLVLIKCNEHIRVLSDPCISSSSLTNHRYQAVIRGAGVKVTKCDSILWRVFPGSQQHFTLPTASIISRLTRVSELRTATRTTKNTRNTENKSAALQQQWCCYGPAVCLKPRAKIVFGLWCSRLLESRAAVKCNTWPWSRRSSIYPPMYLGPGQCPAMALSIIYVLPSSLLAYCPGSET